MKWLADVTIVKLCKKARTSNLTLKDNTAIIRALTELEVRRKLNKLVDGYKEKN